MNTQVLLRALLLALFSMLLSANGNDVKVSANKSAKPVTKSSEAIAEEEQDIAESGEIGPPDSSPFQFPWNHASTPFGPPPIPPPPFSSPFSAPSPYSTPSTAENEEDFDAKRPDAVYWVPNPWIRLVNQAGSRRERPQQESGRSQSVSECNCQAKSTTYQQQEGDYDDEDDQQNEDKQRSQKHEQKSTGITYKGEELTDDNLDFVCTRYMDDKRKEQQALARKAKQRRINNNIKSNRLQGSKRRETSRKQKLVNNSFGTKGISSSQKPSGRAFQAQYQKQLSIPKTPSRSINIVRSDSESQQRKRPQVQSAYYSTS